MPARSKTLSARIFCCKDQDKYSIAPMNGRANGMANTVMQQSAARLIFCANSFAPVEGVAAMSVISRGQAIAVAVAKALSKMAWGTSRILAKRLRA